MRESEDLDGAVRLTLLGGLDIVVVDRFTARVRTLLATRRSVRIDLSRLGFIDCTGLRTIVQALDRAWRDRQRLEVDRPVSAPVKRVITFLDVASELWPPHSGGSRVPLRVIDGMRQSGGDDSGRPVARPAG